MFRNYMGLGGAFSKIASSPFCLFSGDADATAADKVDGENGVEVPSGGQPAAECCSFCCQWDTGKASRETRQSCQPGECNLDSHRPHVSQAVQECD